ncbi:unnamed protein product [Trichogramma brassicae]|uniref:Gamma-aminobutyric acid type B receptor subunit 2 n=1 Tax=Trichogramma brassicae TaxID=86971 RepID=A0A6H5IMK1_9HYME|nr:unnamed protein product [Trichogramma brassicae]
MLYSVARKLGGEEGESREVLPRYNTHFARDGLQLYGNSRLSYADTHPMFTSESFPNFFRIVPSENAFNAPRFALLAQFNWTRVGTIYQNEPRYALAHNRLVSDLDQNHIEVVESQSFATEVTTALEKLKGKDVRIILGNFNEVWARKIFCEAHRLNMFGRKYQWVIVGMYTEEWWLRPDVSCAPLELQEALHGTILTDLLPLSTEQQITVSGITPDEYLVEYDQKRGTEYSRFHGYTYDGIWAVALAVQHVARHIRHFRRNQTVADFRYRDELWEKLFLEALRNTSFEGVTGPVRFYDNERKAYILLKQFQSGSEVKVGEYDTITGTLDLTRGQPLIWRGKSPPKDRTVHIIELSTVNLTIYMVLASVASVGIVMAAIFLAINIKYRNQRYIKMSSPYLNNLIIIGCMFTYSSVIVLGLDSTLSSVNAFPVICTARAWLLMAGFSLAFGSMFSKTWRVHSIFTDVKLNKKVIKDYQLYFVVGVLVLIDITIMSTWQASDPFYRETKQMEPYPHPSSEDIIILPENEYCQSNRMSVYLGSIYAYKGLLMIFGAFLAWETRHVSIPALNDSKYVGMSVYNVVIMCVTGAAISIVLADKQDAMFIMLSVFIIFCSTATLCLVFVPKLIELRRNPQGQIDKRFRPTLRPMSKARRDSTVSEMEERLRDVQTANQKFRKQLHEKESELQSSSPPLPATTTTKTTKRVTLSSSFSSSSSSRRTMSRANRRWWPRLRDRRVRTSSGPERLPEHRRRRRGWLSMRETRRSAQRRRCRRRWRYAGPRTRSTSAAQRLVDRGARTQEAQAAAPADVQRRRPLLGGAVVQRELAQHKFEESLMQRSVSERVRDKAVGGAAAPQGSKSSTTTTTQTTTTGAAGRHMHTVSECPHRAARHQHECARHAPLEAKLRQQSSRLEYVQSTPNVATIHNSKFASSANPRASVQLQQQQQAQKQQSASGGGGGKMSSAVSDGELLDVAILPIFQKLLTERHKSTSHSRYGASIASCPNISIKCDIVEYL